MRRALVAAALLALTAPTARAAMFEGLFAFADKGNAAAPSGLPEPVDPPALRGPQADAGVCIAAIRQAEAAHGIPTDLLLAIGLQEAGMSYKGSMTIWPWSLNVEGRGVRFDTRPDAEAYLAGELAQGRRSIDVGCLQINLRWHPDAFPSPAAGFDPARNADYAARFLRGLYLETGDWLEAAGHYHSATPHLKAIYLSGIERHLARLEGDAASFDALARHAPMSPAGGILLAAGVRLDTPVARRMNPLGAPVRRADADAPQGRFRRTLQALPGAGSGTTRQPVAAQVAGGYATGAAAASLYAPPEPAPVTLTPGPDGLIP